MWISLVSVEYSDENRFVWMRIDWLTAKTIFVSIVQTSKQDMSRFTATKSACECMSRAVSANVNYQSHSRVAWFIFIVCFSFEWPNDRTTDERFYTFIFFSFSYLVHNHGWTVRLRCVCVSVCLSVCAELWSFIDYTIVFLTRFWLISNELLLFRYIVLSFPFYIVELSASYVVHIFVFFHFWAFPIDDIDFGSELIPDMRYHWLSVCKGEKRTNDTESDRGIKLLSQQAAGTIKCYRFSFFFVIIFISNCRHSSDAQEFSVSCDFLCRRRFFVSVFEIITNCNYPQK